MWSRGPRGEARPPKDPRNRWAVVRPSLPALRHGIDLDATVSASPRRTPARDDVRFRGKIGSHGQTVKMTRMTRSRHIGLSKAMALAHTGICQGHGGALLVSCFRRHYSIIGSYFQSRLRSKLYRLRRWVTNPRILIAIVAANSYRVRALESGQLSGHCGLRIRLSGK